MNNASMYDRIQRDLYLWINKERQALECEISSKDFINIFLMVISGDKKGFEQQYNVKKEKVKQ